MFKTILSCSDIFNLLTFKLVLCDILILTHDNCLLYMNIAIINMTIILLNITKTVHPNLKVRQCHVCLTVTEFFIKLV